MLHDIADRVDYEEERREAISDEPEESPWSGMELPAIYRHLLGQGEDPEVAAMIVDEILAERVNGNGNGHTA